MKIRHKTMQTTAKKNLGKRLFRSRASRYLSAFTMVAVALGALIIGPSASAAACATPATDLGTDTITVNVPAAATYTVWTRMQAPDTTHNSINLQVDTSNCYNVGGGSFTATSWATNSSNWINYTDGNAASKVQLALTAGTHTLKFIGTQAGVMVDKIILTSDATCTPSGLGTNCQSGDSTSPVVNLLQPTNGTSITGTYSMKATATDNSGTVSSVQFKANGQVIGSGTASGGQFTYSWNSAELVNGSYSITATATDPTGNSATSTPATVTVTNANGGQKQGDVDGNGKVELRDLSLLLINFGKTNATKAQGDVDGNGKVELRDLSLLLINFGK